ncbi:putative O-glycosylation ligase, exosortase A system-associated [Vibrio sp. HN007]|uniref:putative O-glycosylation ligase, exosortase A system-associated n=1 Tax=Vibrio iocasae TaxID=3098914 RepID=UPI0035D45B3B
MRDLVFIAVFLVLIFFSFRHAFTNLALWLWAGLFVPTNWIHGIGTSISYNSVFALLTMISYLFQRNKAKIGGDGLFLLVVIFFIHTSITSLLSSNTPMIVENSWTNFAKGILLFIFTSLIIRSKSEFKLIIWVITLSVGFQGCVEALKFLASGGGHRIFGPLGHLHEDNNHFAAVLTMVLPLIIFLTSITEKKVVKLSLRIILVLCVLAILGTHSRGGLIAISTTSIYFWFQSKSKMKIMFGAVLVIALAVSFLPQNWYNRMNTIETAATSDGSFIGRIISWKMHTLIAMDKPLTGGGFKAMENSYIFGSYVSDIDKLDFIYTPDPVRAKAAHSIYFQVLGDHGFLGLILFGFIILLSFKRLRFIRNHYRSIQSFNSWQYNLANMLQVSLLSYCVAGAALSLAYAEIFYALVGLTICLYINTKDQIVEDTKVSTAEYSR